jgi:alpha-galactosidase
MPADELLEQELAEARERIAKQNAERGRDDALPTMAELREGYGRDYRLMIDNVKDTLSRCGELFPELARREPKLCGLVWFQGWNDQYGGKQQRYEQNLRHLIADVRRDLGAAELPVVIGVMGQNGKDEAKGAMQAIQQAQRAVGDVPGVRAVATDVLVDEAAWALYPEWQQQQDEWQRTGSDHPYHYLGSAIWYSRIGYAFADAMLELTAR